MLCSRWQSISIALVAQNADFGNVKHLLATNNLPHAQYGLVECMLFSYERWFTHGQVRLLY
jgi:hypothetical protein